MTGIRYNYSTTTFDNFNGTPLVKQSPTGHLDSINSAYFSSSFWLASDLKCIE